jgi:hypothetical protein
MVIPAGKAHGRSGKSWEWIFVALVSAALAVRLVLLANRYCVNVLYFDEWDYLTTRFSGAGVWATFAYQHGPHRQGVGGWMTALVLWASDWNARAEGFANVGVLISACGLALWLKVRVVGRVAWWDVFVPLVVLSPMQFEQWAAVPNPAHGVLPMLLMLGVCHTWVSRPMWVRYGASAGLVFLTTFTGFGLFACPTAVALWCFELWACSRERRPDGTDVDANRADYWRRVMWILGALVCAGVTGALFLRGYRVEASVPGWTFPAANWPQYPEFAATALGEVTGRGAMLDLARHGGADVWVGWCVLAAAVVAWGVSAWRLVRGRGSRVDVVAGILLTWGMLYLANLAVGRLLLAMAAARSSRYATLLGIVLLGVYFFALGMRWAWWRGACLVALVASQVNASVALRRWDLDGMRSYCRLKQNWSRTYRRTHDISAADAASGACIHPAPVPTHLREKLDYLEGRKLSLFRGE